MAGHPARLTPPWWRRAGRVALLVTLALHALVGRQVGELIAPIDPATPPLQRIQAAYTRSVDGFRIAVAVAGEHQPGGDGAQDMAQLLEVGADGRVGR